MSWTCARCAVTVRWMPGNGEPQLPETWVEENGGLYCLGCRRALAAEAELDAAPEDTPRSGRAKIRSRAMLEFEVKRDPSRSNVEIARSVRASVPAVQKARDRLGV